jgi:catechol 2,3-dioxygenase-like lactoylglutathione lyase family enzyme
MSPRDPEEAAGAGAPAVAEIPAQTTVGEVHLTVADADRSAGFYESAVGLRVRERGDGRLVLGGDRDLLVLHELPGATPAHGYSGLYHFALLLPEREDLARPGDDRLAAELEGHRPLEYLEPLWCRLVFHLLEGSPSVAVAASALRTNSCSP